MRVTYQGKISEDHITQDSRNARVLFMKRFTIIEQTRLDEYQGIRQGKRSRIDLVIKVKECI